jgi:hypothetical protein
VKRIHFCLIFLGFHLQQVCALFFVARNLLLIRSRVDGSSDSKQFRLDAGQGWISRRGADGVYRACAGCHMNDVSRASLRAGASGYALVRMAGR